MNRNNTQNFYFNRFFFIIASMSTAFIFCLIFVGSPVYSQSANCPNKNIGDADCVADGTGKSITLIDFQIWRNEFFSACSNIDLVKCGTDEDRDGSEMDANFDYPGSGSSFTDTNVTIADFEIWRKGYFSGQNITTTPANTPTPTVTPTPTPQNAACLRPYSTNSPWNTPIVSPQYDPQNTQYISSLTGTFGSDPTMYTLPVYELKNPSEVQMKTVYLTGNYSVVTNNGLTVTVQKGSVTSPLPVQMPIPSGAQPAAGTDAQIVVWNKINGDEYGLWQAQQNSDGSWSGTNGYKYNTNWDGVPPKGFLSRGPAMTYLSGLIRPCEIAQGHIDHTIAFAYQNTARAYVYPATKSDGGGTAPPAIPEGARLQLDPALTDSQLSAKGCVGVCLIIAHALQTYGMMVADTSGHPKIYPEYEGTAHWNGAVNANTVKNIPYSSFKLIKLPNLQY